MVTALVTGASSGIGAEFARQLAQRNYDLVLVARSSDKLTAIANDLAVAHGIQTQVIVQDLTAPDAADQVLATLSESAIAIDLLVNNAGFGTYGEFSGGDISTYLNMVQLNVKVLVELTYRCLQGMKQRQQGSIINISSTAAFQPIPYFAVYAASKAFVLSFSESLWYECKPFGVKVLGVCPGPTETAFFKTADFPDTMETPPAQSLTTPEQVVQDAFAALERGDSHTVAGGLSNQVVVNVNRFLPREVITSTVGRMFKA